MSCGAATASNTIRALITDRGTNTFVVVTNLDRPLRTKSCKLSFKGEMQANETEIANEEAGLELERLPVTPMTLLDMLRSASLRRV